MNKFDLTSKDGKNRFERALREHFASQGTPFLERYGIQRVSYGVSSRWNHETGLIFDLVHRIATEAVTKLNQSESPSSRTMVAMRVADATVVETGQQFMWPSVCLIIERSSRADLLVSHLRELEEIYTYVRLVLSNLPKGAQQTPMSLTRNLAKTILWATVFTFLVENDYGPIPVQE